MFVKQIYVRNIFLLGIFTVACIVAFQFNIALYLLFFLMPAFVWLKKVKQGLDSGVDYSLSAFSIALFMDFIIYSLDITFVDISKFGVYVSLINILIILEVNLIFYLIAAFYFIPLNTSLKLEKQNNNFLICLVCLVSLGWFFILKTEYIFFFKNILFIWGTLAYIFIYLFIVTAGFSKQNAIYFNLAIFGFILFISFFQSVIYWNNSHYNVYECLFLPTIGCIFGTLVFFVLPERYFNQKKYFRVLFWFNLLFIISVSFQFLTQAIHLDY